MLKKNDSVIMIGIVAAIAVICAFGESFADPPTVKFVVNPNSTDVYLGSDPIAITARAVGKNLKFTWELLGPGKLDGQGAAAVFYILPEKLSGASEKALITVTVTDSSGQEVRESITLNIFPSSPGDSSTGSFSLDDLEKAAQHEEKSQAKWDAQLKEMEDAFAQVTAYEERDISADLKIKAWERFLQTFPEDNPQTKRDEELRSQANERMRVLKKAETPAAASSAPSKPRLSPSAKTFTDPITEMEFIWIEGGCFEMGQTAEEKQVLIQEVGKKSYGQYFSDETPRHKVCVDGFWMAKYEVTNKQYRLWKKKYRPAGCVPVEDTFYTEEDTKYTKSYILPTEACGAENFLNQEAGPVVGVTGNNAQEFTEWLTKQHKNQYLFRLPTEAEWEYACRAGTTTSRYWGEDSQQTCEYENAVDHAYKRDKNTWFSPWKLHECTDGYMSTAPVGSFTPNPLGLYDILGNVAEWCGDKYDANYYKNSPSQNPTGPSSGRYRTVRGGSYGASPIGMRCAVRDKRDPYNGFIDAGIRVIIDGKKAPK